MDRRETLHFLIYNPRFAYNHSAITHPARRPLHTRPARGPGARDARMPHRRRADSAAKHTAAKHAENFGKQRKFRNFAAVWRPMWPQAPIKHQVT